MADAGDQMRREWDAIARENAFFGIAAWNEFADPSRADEQRFWRSGAVLADNLLEHLRLREARGLTAVEIGCGIGRVTHRLAERFREVWALDVSPEMIARAEARWGGLANVRFIVGSGADLEPVPADSCDVVLSFITLHHVTDPAVVLGYLRETARVLRRGGQALLHLHTIERNPLRRLVARLARGGRGAPFDPWWDRGFEPDLTAPASPPAGVTSRRVWRGCRVPMGAVRRAARAARLRIERAEGAGTFWTFLTVRKA
jgi:ubiquinone/menaquinone biosynthesis C-methylase UbiE